MPKEYRVTASLTGEIWIEASSAEEAKAIADETMGERDWLPYMELHVDEAREEDAREVKVPEWKAQLEAGVA